MCCVWCLVGRPRSNAQPAAQGGQWFLCDDEAITLASRAQVLGSQAYMLFYIKTRLEYE